MAGNKEMKLLLIDAYALIFRAYYAFIRNPMYNSTGLNTSAIFGFVTTLEDVLNKENPSHIALVFDPPGGSFRSRLYKEYKANREETPEDIKISVPFIKKIAEAYRIPVVEIPDYEADDVIGTLARKAEKRDFTVYMMTPDKDFAQLVTDRVKMYKPGRGGNEAEIWGVEEVKKRFRVDEPARVIDILALWGDSSDNIPGAPGIGEKYSQKLISEYGSLQGVYNNIDKLRGKQKDSLVNFREQVELSYRLATIVTDAPVELDEKKFRLEIPDKERLTGLFAELNFENLAQRVLKRISANSEKSGFSEELFGAEEMQGNNFQTIESQPHRYFLVEDEAGLHQLSDELIASGNFCFDTETTSLDVFEAELVGISFSRKAYEAFYVPVPAERKAADKILSILKKVLENESVRKIGQNCKFDIQVLHKYGVEIKGTLFDTMLAHYLLEPEGRHNMNYLAETYLKYRTVHIEELIGEKGKSQTSMRDVPREKIRDYACEDADVTFRLAEILEPLLRKEGMHELAVQIEMPLIRVLAAMELAGVSIREEVLDRYSVELGKELNEIEKEIFRHAGVDFNISSPKKLGEILFEKLRISDRPARTKTGQYATNEEMLTRLADKHPVVPLILDHRSVKKLLSTYVEALPRLIHPVTKKLHTTYNQTITSTGRLSSVNPNLQNIPIREERGREIRKAFVPSGDDRIFLSADYSQIELRLMAHMSGDENMLDAFNRREDIHSATAARIHRVSPGEVTREMRTQAKTANFGIIYGISAFGLAQRLHIDRSHARSLIDGYFQSYPGVKTYMDNCIREAREKGYVVTLFGRKRYLPDIHSRNAVVRGMAERNAINAPIQGSAADLIKLAMVNIYSVMKKLGMKSEMILQVHDELVFDAVYTELNELKRLVKKEMENVYPLRVPLEVEMGEGGNWLEAH